MKFKKNIATAVTLAAILAVNCAYAEGVAPGATLLTTIASWLKGIGVVTCTIALMIAGYKFLFQQARLNDVANIIIGGILIGSAAIIAALIMV